MVFDEKEIVEPNGNWGRVISCLDKVCVLHAACTVPERLEKLLSGYGLM
jgi:hypothetical protein